MAWVYLGLAGLFEIVWALSLKFMTDFSRPLPIVIMLTAMAFSLAFMSQAIRGIPLGTVYAVWTGIGAAGVAVVGMIWFGEPATLPRIGCLLVVIAGIAGLKIVS